MERDFGKELDELKNEVKRLGELLDGKAAAGKDNRISYHFLSVRQKYTDTVFFFFIKKQFFYFCVIVNLYPAFFTLFL